MKCSVTRPPVMIHSLNSVSSASNNSAKTVHIIRHAQGTHNVDCKYNDVANFDARLTDKGKEQCSRFVHTLATERSTDGWTQLRSALQQQQQEDILILSSPLIRCIQTAVRCFVSDKTNFTQAQKVVLHEALRETVNYTCDRRYSVKETKKILKDNPKELLGIDAAHDIQFDSSSSENCRLLLDFRNVPDSDEIWNKYEERLGPDHDAHRESGELYKVAERGREFFTWLHSRPESTVVICTHSAVMRCWWNYGIEQNDASLGVPNMPPQCLDERSEEDRQPGAANPVVSYSDAETEQCLRPGFDNCELRSVRIEFPGCLGSQNRV